MHPVNPSTFKYGEGVKSFFREKFSVEPEFIYYNEENENNIKKIMESEDSPDLVLDMYVATGYELGEEGYLLDLQTVEHRLPNYLKLWDDQFKKDMLMKSITKKDLSSYFTLIPCVYSRPSGGWLNNMLFEHYKYETPDSIEELYDLSLAHKQDTKNVPIDIYSYGNNPFTDDLFEGIASAFGTTSFLFAYDSEGKYMSPITDENWYNALCMYQKFREQNLVKYFDNNWAEYNDLNNKCIFTYGKSQPMRTDT